MRTHKTGDGADGPGASSDRSPRRLLVLLAFALLLASWWAPSADAQFPGANGEIAYDADLFKRD